MSGRKILFVLFLATAAAVPHAAQAQFSPRGLLGAITQPFREMLGRFGQLRRYHAHEARPALPSSHFASSQFGDVGPDGWPNAYEDVVGFTFWPDRYAEVIPAHGFDVIADALVDAGRGRQVARETTGSAQNDGNGNVAQGCTEPSDEQITWPTSQIEKDIKLDGKQRAALDKLRTAVAHAVEMIKASCTNLQALSPLDRLQTTVQKIWAIRDGGVDIRAPLEAFYDSLSDEQKKEFTWKQADVHAGRDAGPDNNATAKQYQACAAPNREASERLLRQIEEEVHPTKAQDQAMRDLRQTAGDMAKLLTAPCAQPIPEDPLARLDAANDQLSNLSYAATSMEIALDGFYAQLDEGQKAKFDSLGH